MKIYLAGSVPKGDKEASRHENWRLAYSNKLKLVFDAEFVMPYGRKIDESDFQLVVGGDCKHIKESDLIIVNAETKIGAGTAQELVIAKYFKKPVITVLPPNTYHRRKNVKFHRKIVKDWIHPFIWMFSDFIVDNVDNIKNTKNQLATTRIKDIKTIDKAIKYFETKTK
jgi:hypothetical protein